MGHAYAGMSTPVPQAKLGLCPMCNYSAAPDLVFTNTKHFDAHAYRCVRCKYTTETKGTWAAARNAWNVKS